MSFQFDVNSWPRWERITEQQMTESASFVTSKTFQTKYSNYIYRRHEDWLFSKNKLIYMQEKNLIIKT